jgi:thiamine biosynthesis lipoprotein
MDVFREYGITSGMVSLGGNVQVLNRKTDGTCWKIGIRDPQSESGDVLAAVEVENEAVITSGGYERYFEQDGNTYIHIIDPRTGYPADGDLTSVTIISEDGMLADALSTSLYIMGLEQASDYWRSYGTSFDMVLVTTEGELYVTEGISDRLTSDSEIQVLER